MSKLEKFLARFGYTYARVVNYDGSFFDGFKYTGKEEAGDGFIRYALKDSDISEMYLVKDDERDDDESDFLTYEDGPEDMYFWYPGWHLAAEFWKLLEEYLKIHGELDVKDKNIPMSWFYEIDNDKQIKSATMQKIYLDEDGYAVVTGKKGKNKWKAFLGELDRAEWVPVMEVIGMDTSMPEGYVDFIYGDIKDMSKKAFELIPKLPGIDNVLFNLLKVNYKGGGKS